MHVAHRWGSWRAFRASEGRRRSHEKGTIYGWMALSCCFLLFFPLKVLMVVWVLDAKVTKMVPLYEGDVDRDYILSFNRFATLNLQHKKLTHVPYLWSWLIASRSVKSLEAILFSCSGSVFFFFFHCRSCQVYMKPN